MKLRWANPHARQDDRECGVLLYTNVECGTVAMSNLEMRDVVARVVAAPDKPPDQASNLSVQTS